MKVIHKLRTMKRRLHAQYVYKKDFVIQAKGMGSFISKITDCKRNIKRSIYV